MAPQLSCTELDFMRKQAGGQDGKSPVEVHRLLSVRRRRSRQSVPDLTSVRRVLKGLTHCVGKPEKRGHPRKLSRANVRRLNTVRKASLKKARREKEVHIDEVLTGGGLPTVSWEMSIAVVAGVKLF